MRRQTDARRPGLRRIDFPIPNEIPRMHERISAASCRGSVSSEFQRATVGDSSDYFSKRRAPANSWRSGASGTYRTRSPVCGAEIAACFETTSTT
jgi:hypothetical protein